MHARSAKLLEDIRDAAAFIRSSTGAKSIDQYRSDRLLRQALERNLEIIGEALNRLSKTDARTAECIDHAAEIVGFRNVLIHGYDLVDDERVWATITKDVPRLEEQVMTMLQQNIRNGET